MKPHLPIAHLLTERAASGDSGAGGSSVAHRQYAAAEDSESLVWSEAEGQPLDRLPGGLAPEGVLGRILIVEDEPLLRELIAGALRNEGYRVGCAEDGEAGWEALCAHTCILLITDHDMPKLTGLELLRKVRASQFALPAIMISGKMPWDESDFLKLLEPGAAIEKPFTLAELVAKVRTFTSPEESAMDDFGQSALRS